MRRSLGTTDRALAKRKLTDLQRDVQHVEVGAGRLSLADLCDRLLETVANQSASTLEQKTQIATRIKTEWRGAVSLAIDKVTPSSISTFLARYRFGASSYNHHLLFIRAAFQMAVNDKLLAHSPAATLEQRQREKPIRRTPKVHTDEYGAYHGLKGKGYQHDTVNHGKEEWVRGDVHTNGIEGFWSQMKRSIDGTHHHVGKKHLQKYADEYAFRFNRRRSEKPMFAHLVSQMNEQRG